VSEENLLAPTIVPSRLLYPADFVFFYESIRADLPLISHFGEQDCQI
jgi:hypothetical protein